MSELSIPISVRGQKISLFPDKVAYWEEKDILLVADVHFGKVSHFRKSGLAVPVGVMGTNAFRLMKLFDQLKPKQCIFLGDLFHSSYNKDWENIKEVVSNYGHINFILIRGNHDIVDTESFTDLGLDVMDDLILSEIHMTHHPLENPEFFNICGHLHPGVKLSNSINFTEKLPCFFLRPNQLILPSFGSFTGKKAIRPKAGDRVFVVAGDEVVEVGG
jgi:DNA ligase-associated metallophosphoesterase